MIRRWALAFSLLLFADGSAVAEPFVDPTPPDTVVVIDSGSADLSVEALVRTATEDVLRAQDYQIMGTAEIGGDTPAKLLACAGDLPCTVSVLRSIGAAHVFFLSLRLEDEPKTDAVNLKIVARKCDPATGEITKRIMKRCPECHDPDVLVVFAKDVMRVLLSQNDQAEHEESPSEHPPEPIANEQTSLSAWRSTSSSDAQVAIHKSSSVSPFVYAGATVGISALAAGTVLVLMDGPVIENGKRQPNARDTKLGGYATLGAGAALVGLSVWMWAKADDGPERSTQLSVVPAEDGLSMVLGGEF